MRVLVLNGPNLNLLGTREPELYGRTTLAEIEARVTAVGAELGVECVFVQSNHEGELVDVIQAHGATVGGAVVNAGAYTHTSLAIVDALTGVRMPFVEVHLTNIHAREPERRRSLLSRHALGVVVGFGADGYELALRGLVSARRAGR